MQRALAMLATAAQIALPLPARAADMLLAHNMTAIHLP